MNQEMKTFMQLQLTGLELGKVKAAMSLLMGDAPNKEVQTALNEIFVATQKAMDVLEVQQFKLDD